MTEIQHAIACPRCHSNDVSDLAMIEIGMDVVTPYQCNACGRRFVPRKSAGTTPRDRIVISARSCD